jgi:hypothetical protein
MPSEPSSCWKAANDWGRFGTVPAVTVAALYLAIAAFHDRLGALAARLCTSGLLGVSLGGVQ